MVDYQKYETEIKTLIQKSFSSGEDVKNTSVAKIVSSMVTDIQNDMLNEIINNLIGEE